MAKGRQHRDSLWVDSAGGTGKPVQKEGEITPDKQKLIDTIINKDSGRITITEGALEHSLAAVKEYFEDDPEKIRVRIENNFSRFPTPLLNMMADAKLGHVKVSEHIGDIFSSDSAEYSRRTNVIDITTWAIQMDTGIFEEEVAHWIDHLLGSAGERIDETMSAGFGINPKIEKLGGKIYSLYNDENQSINDYARNPPQEYLGQAVKLYLTDREELQKKAPGMYNIIDRGWFKDAFWEGMLK